MTATELELVKKVVTAVQTGIEYSVLILDNSQKPLNNCVLVYPGIGQLSHSFTGLEAKDIAAFIGLAPQIITRVVADVEKGARLLQDMQKLVEQLREEGQARECKRSQA